MADYSIIPVLNGDITIANIVSQGIPIYYNNGDQNKVYICASSYTKGGWYLNGVKYYVLVSNLPNTRIYIATLSSSSIINQQLSSRNSGLYYFQDYTNADVMSFHRYSNFASIIADCNDGIWGAVTYPITYSSSNATISGPSEAAVGDTVTVSAVPDNNYGITDAASQILVTNNDAAVPYQWNPSTNTIVFTMPDPT